MAGATHDFGLSGWSGYGDILVCDIARERCTLAVPGPDAGLQRQLGDGFRLVPHLDPPELTRVPVGQGHGKEGRRPPLTRRRIPHEPAD